MASAKPRTGDSATFSVGIDLGTTNCAIACADIRDVETPGPVEVLPILQLVQPGEVAPLTLLPSFLYIAGDLDFPAGSLSLPWEDQRGRPPHIVGELARKRGSESPARLVSSAKSWLSHAAVNRTAAILPWGAPEEVPKLSPVTDPRCKSRAALFIWRISSLLFAHQNTQLA